VVGIGEICMPFAPGLECAEGLLCDGPAADGAYNCFEITVLAEGEACEPGSDRAPCGANLFCRDFDDDGNFTCTAPMVVEVGEPCEPFEGLITCREPAVCMDESGFGDYVCVEVNFIAEGGACEVGDELNLCAEGTACADLDGDEATTCTALTPENAVCPAAYGEVAELASDAAGPWTVQLDTTQSANSTRGICGGRGVDAPVVFTAPADGLYIAYTDAEFDTVLYAREYCGIPVELACDDDDDRGTTSTIEVALTAGQTVYFIVDAFGDGDLGPVSLTVEAAAP
jgi:hypothetical protein